MPIPYARRTLGRLDGDYGALSMRESITRPGRNSARLLGVAIVVVIGVVPLILDRDSYPLSTYPMFSSRRSSIEPVHTAVAVEADGSIRRLSPTQISGNDEIIIAAQIVRDAIVRDGGAVLCDDIAQRVVDSVVDGSSIQIVTERFDAIEWYQGRRDPISRVVHTSCTVPGTGS